jgi:hypothetical protein
MSRQVIHRIGVVSGSSNVNCGHFSTVAFWPTASFGFTATHAALHANRPTARASSLPVSGSQGASYAAGDSSPCVVQFPAWRSGIAGPLG